MAWTGKRKAKPRGTATPAVPLEVDEPKSRRPRMKPCDYPVKSCLLCGKEFRSKPCAEQVYCSFSCGMKAAGAKRLAKRIEKQCQACSAVIKVKPSHQEVEGTYCSKICMAIGYRERLKGGANPNWKDGISSSPEYNKINYKKAAIKRAIAKRIDPAVPSEHEEQSWLVAECRRRGGAYESIFAIPNGGVNINSKPAQARLKREGRTAGIPDLFLPAAAGRYHGMFIELKRTKGGKVTPEQAVWINRLREAGYCALVCLGYVAAIKAIEHYLAGRIVRFGPRLHDYEVTT